MTATDQPASESTTPRLLRMRHALASEWTKVRSVRSTIWTLLIAGITAIGGSVVIAFAAGSNANASASASESFDPVASIYLAWLEYPVLALGVLGVLAFTSEFATGQIRTTYTAVPRRRAVLAAKAAVVGTITLVLAEVLSFIAFFVGEAILSARHRGVSLGDPGALRAVLSAGISLCAVALLGVALGAIIRHTAGGVVALPALIYLPLALVSLPAPWGNRIGKFTALMASYQLVSVHPRAGLLPPPLSLLVLLAWPAALLVLAAALIDRDT